MMSTETSHLGITKWTRTWSEDTAQRPVSQCVKRLHMKDLVLQITALEIFPDIHSLLICLMPFSPYSYSYSPPPLCHGFVHCSPDLILESLVDFVSFFPSKSSYASVPTYEYAIQLPETWCCWKPSSFDSYWRAKWVPTNSTKPQLEIQLLQPLMGALNVALCFFSQINEMTWARWEISRKPLTHSMESCRPNARKVW